MVNPWHAKSELTSFRYPAALHRSLISLGIVEILIAPCITIYQVFDWLKFGKWQPLTLSNLFDFFNIPRFTSQWIGVQKVIEYFVNFSLTFFLFFMGLGLVLLGTQVLELKERKDVF